MEEQDYVWVVTWEEETDICYIYETRYKVFTSKQHALNFKYELLDEGYRNVQLEKKYN